MYKLVISAKNAEGKTVRVAYVNENTEGVYLGNFFKDGWHISYHTDGTVHNRRGIDSKDTFEVKRTRIPNISAFEQVSFQAVVLTNPLLDKDTSIEDAQEIKIDGLRKNTLNLDFYLVNNSNPDQFSNLLSNYTFSVLKTHKINLSLAPSHVLYIVFSEQESAETTKSINGEPTKYGVINKGKFKGRKVVISPRNHLESNEWVIETFPPNKKAKIPVYSKACLIHEMLIPDNGCPKCN